MKESDLIQIDVRQVIEGKLGPRAKFVPKWLINWLRRTICEDQLNEKLRKFYPSVGSEFCDKAVADFGLKVKIKNPENLPPKEDRRIIIVCNHPLGGLDGIVLISELTRIYGKGVKFIVNDLLMALGPLQEVFLPINKHGKQSRESIAEINAAMAADDPIVVFPAGLVSRKGKNGEIKDLAWQKMFVAKALQHRRDVLPIYFDGENSSFFYSLAQWRKRLGIGFNIEMLYLPQEMLRSVDKEFTVTIGKRIPWQKIQEMGAHANAAQEIKEMTYSLKHTCS